MDFHIVLGSSRLEIKRSKVGRFGSGRIDLSKLLRRSAVLFRAADPNVVRQLDTGSEEVVPGIDAKDGAEAVLKVVLLKLAVISRTGGRTYSSSGLKVDTGSSSEQYSQNLAHGQGGLPVDLEPGSPKHT